MGRPDCPHCGGLGYVVPDVEPNDPSFGQAVPCSCREADQSQERFQRLLRLSQLGALEAYTFDNFLIEGRSKKAEKNKALETAFSAAHAYAQKPRGWLVLHGGYGCGKTHLAAAIGNTRINMGHQVLFINTPDLLDHLRSTYSPSSEVGYDERFEQVRSAPMLILDDLGAQSKTEWAQEKLYQIFNHRYTNQLPTVITTNESLLAIDKRIRSRILDSDLSIIININAPDFRVGDDHTQSDLSTLHLHADQTFGTFDMRIKELDSKQAGNLKRAFETAMRFAADPRDWLVFSSTAYGNGKTHLAAAIANAIDMPGESKLFVVVPDFLDYLRATFSPGSGARLDRRFDEVKNAKLLILDDLGTESATDWAREKMYQLFNYRYIARKATVITTSIHIDDIDPKLSSRMLDTTHCTFFVLKVPSYRGRATTQRKPRYE